jgi:hypothetical protein
MQFGVRACRIAQFVPLNALKCCLYFQTLPYLRVLTVGGGGNLAFPTLLFFVTRRIAYHLPNKLILPYHLHCTPLTGAATQPLADLRRAPAPAARVRRQHEGDGHHRREHRQLRADARPLRLYVSLFCVACVVVNMLQLLQCQDVIARGDVRSDTVTRSAVMTRLRCCRVMWCALLYPT